MFSVEIATDLRPWQVHVRGQITELSNFPMVDFSSQKTVILNVEGIQSMNSIGIHRWVTWISEFPDDTEFIYRKCPAFFFVYLGTFIGMIPKRAGIESFYVRYVNPSTEDAEMIEYRNGHQFNSAELMMPAHVTSENSCQALQLDIMPARLLVSLQKFYPKVKLF